MQRIIKIKDAFVFLKKSKIKAGDGLEVGKYPFYTSSSVLSKYLDSYEIEDESLIFGTGGSASVHHSHGKFSSSTDCFVVQSNNKFEINLRYVYLFLSGNIHILENGFKGAGLKHISKKYLEDVEIPLPPLETQKKIVEVLDKAQGLIDARKEQIRLMDELIQSVFYEMFGDPVTNPKGWKKNTIGSVVQSITAGWSANGEARNRKEDEKAVLKVSSVTQGYFKEDEYKVINKSQRIKKYVFPEKGDLLFSRANTREMVGATCVIEKDYPNLLLPDKLWKVLFTKNADVYFMKYILTHPSVRAEFSAKSTGTSGSMYNVSMEKFKNIEIPVPPIRIQNQYSQFVEMMTKKKMEMTESINELQLCYHSLMQKSFKGEIFGGE